MSNNFNQKLLLYLVLAIISVILLPMTLRQGMFTDGLIYAAISNNLAQGIGSFWHPVFTGDVYSPFHEHPPLMFGIESIFYKILGDSMYVERFLTISFTFISAFLLLRIWKHLFADFFKTAWLVILFWFLTPIVFWSFSNNMMENLITITYLFGIYFTVRYKKETRFKFRWLVYVGIVTAAGFMIKGPVGLLPMVFPVVLTFENRTDIWRSILNGIISFLVFAVIMAILLIPEEARNSFQVYYDTQITGSLGGDRVVVQRTYILERLLMEILPFLGITLLYFLVRRRKWNNEEAGNKTLGYQFLTLGFLAVLPIMISPKQLMFYVVPAIPFFIMSVVSFFENHLRNDVTRMISKKHFKKITLISTTLVTLLAIVLGIVSTTIHSRNSDLIGDVHKVGDHLQKEKELYIHPSINQNWSMFAYFQKMQNISCFRNQMKDQMVAEIGVSVDSTWQKVELNTKMLELYVKK